MTVHTASSHELYADIGLHGTGVGYAYSFNEHVGVRADISTVGRNISAKGTFDRLQFDATWVSNQLGVYADWFPFKHHVRLSAGLHSRQLEVDVLSHHGRVSAFGRNIPLFAGDEIHVKVKWPRLAPYLGIGWGHQDSHRKGLGLIVDLGVSFGSPTTELTLNQRLNTRLNLLGRFIGEDVAAEIERQHRTLGQDFSRIKVFPHLEIGVSYHF